MILSTLASLVLATVPIELTAIESADLVEVNHFYDECGKHVFDQIIWYDWDAYRSRFDVIAWRLVKGREILPQRDHECGGWVQVWLDGTVMRRVRSASRCETWTQFDPELVERESLPKEHRRELRK